MIGSRRGRVEGLKIALLPGQHVSALGAFERRNVTPEIFHVLQRFLRPGLEAGDFFEISCRAVGNEPEGDDQQERQAETRVNSSSNGPFHFAHILFVKSRRADKRQSSNLNFVLTYEPFELLPNFVEVVRGDFDLSHAVDILQAGLFDVFHRDGDLIDAGQLLMA